MDFSFIHKKRIPAKNEQGTNFGFEHIKRIPPSVPPMESIFLPGAFDPNSFDLNSFWDGGWTLGIMTSIKDFLFKHIG